MFKRTAQTTLRDLWFSVALLGLVNQFFAVPRQRGAHSTGGAYKGTPWLGKGPLKKLRNIKKDSEMEQLQRGTSGSSSQECRNKRKEQQKSWYNIVPYKVKCGMETFLNVFRFELIVIASNTWRPKRKSHRRLCCPIRLSMTSWRSLPLT